MHEALEVTYHFHLGLYRCAWWLGLALFAFWEFPMTWAQIVHDNKKGAAIYLYIMGVPRARATRGAAGPTAEPMHFGVPPALSKPA